MAERKDRAGGGRGGRDGSRRSGKDSGRDGARGQKRTPSRREDRPDRDREVSGRPARTEHRRGADPGPGAARSRRAPQPDGQQPDGRRQGDGRRQRDGRQQPDGRRQGDGRRQPRVDDPDGFGPFAGESRAFEGGRRRRPAGEGEPAVRKVARDAVARGAARRESALRLIRETAPKEDREDGSPAPRRPRRRSQPARELAPTPPPASGPRPPRLADALEKASRAIERGYEQEALRILRPLKDRHPTDPDVRELNGIALYRAGRWVAARKELEAFVELTGSANQHPLLMDSARALGRHTVVDRLWEELRAASPAAEIMTEGRIVAAGSLADRGRLPEAIKLLERGPVSPKRIAGHHLRLWYALADLYERAGDIPGARALFRKVSARDPGFVDVAERLSALS